MDVTGALGHSPRNDPFYDRNGRPLRFFVPYVSVRWLQFDDHGVVGFRKFRIPGLFAVIPVESDPDLFLKCRDELDSTTSRKPEIVQRGEILRCGDSNK